MSKTASSGKLINFGELQRHFRDMPNDIPTAIVLVAPTNKIAKQWRKKYPGIKVTTARRYYSTAEFTIPLPKDYHFSTPTPKAEDKES